MIYSIEGTIWKIEQKNKLFKLIDVSERVYMVYIVPSILNFKDLDQEI